MTCQNHNALRQSGTRLSTGPLSVSIYLQGTGEEASGQVLAAILRAANVVAGKPLYEVELYRNLQTNPSAQGGTVVLLGNQEDRWSIPEDDHRALRRLLLNADRVMLVGSAVFLPLETGLGTRETLALHSNFVAAMVEEYPEQPVSSGPTAEAHRFASAVSPFAAQKLLISAIAKDYGELTAKSISHYVGLQDSTSTAVPSEIWKYVKKSSGDRLVYSVLKAMSKHIEEPLSINEIANIVGTSARQVQRQFKSKTDASPLHVYREIRLNYAHNLVRRSNLPVIDVALAAGFQNYATFNDNFKRQYGISPTNMRKALFFGVR